MSVLQRGDRLVVSKLSRLGRSLGQIVTILDALTKAGVADALKWAAARRRLDYNGRIVSAAGAAAWTQWRRRGPG